MSSFLAAGIKIADLISNLGTGLDGGYLARLSQICMWRVPDNDRILTCGVACYHPQDPPPSSQDPVVTGQITKGNISVQIHFTHTLQKLRIGSILSLKTKNSRREEECITSGAHSIFFVKPPILLNHLRGPFVVLFGCAQLAAPQKLLRSDRRHFVLGFWKRAQRPHPSSKCLPIQCNPNVLNLAVFRLNFHLN